MAKLKDAVIEVEEYVGRIIGECECIDELRERVARRFPGTWNFADLDELWNEFWGDYNYA